MTQHPDSHSSTPDPEPPTRDPKPIALTIAGSDSGGGAGIQADIKSMEANGVFATSVLTAITAQNTQAVTAAFDLPIDLIEAQIEAVFSDFQIGAVKTGMLSSVAIIQAVVKKIDEWQVDRLVVDPVMISTSGFTLLDPQAVQVIIDELISRALVVTPNTHEASLLTGKEIQTIPDAEIAARQIKKMGAKSVLVKGGHLEGDESRRCFFRWERYLIFQSAVHKYFAHAWNGVYVCLGHCGKFSERDGINAGYRTSQTVCDRSHSPRLSNRKRPRSDESFFLPEGRSMIGSRKRRYDFEVLTLEVFLNKASIAVEPRIQGVEI